MLIQEFTKDTFKVQVFDTIRDAAVFEKWNCLHRPGFDFDVNYLSAIEKSQPADLSFRYLLIQANEKIVARVYFQVLNFGNRNLSVDTGNFLLRIASFFIRFSPYKIIIGGNLFAVDFSPLDYLKNEISVEGLLEIISTYVRKEKYDVFALKDLSSDFTSHNMYPFGLTEFKSDLTMELAVRSEWKSFVDYEKSLTHKYAQRARKIRRAAASIERIELTHDLFLLHRERISELFKSICAKQTIRMGIVDDRYFEEMRKACGINFMMTGYFLEGKLIAFTSMFDRPDKLEVHYIGMDYSYNKSHSLYFNILFDGIENAIRLKKNSLELGRTAREAKAVIGCEPVYFNDYIHINSYMTRKIVDLLQKFFQQRMGESWKERHPFKQL